MALAVTLVANGPPAADGPVVRSISGRVDGGLSTVLIEATEPVAYLTSQPDPLTVLVDLRQARTDGLNTASLTEMSAPVAGVNVESATAPDGVPVARVRVALERPATHRVRSSRNLIFVEVDRAAVPQPSDPGPRALLTAPVAARSNARASSASAGVATRLTAVRPLTLPDGTAIALTGNGRLVASNVEAIDEQPARVLLDFEGVAMGSVPARTAVNLGDVQRVRVGVNSSDPLITRVVIDLAKKIPYTVETVGEELRVFFARAADAAASLVTPEPTATDASASTAAIAAPASATAPALGRGEIPAASSPDALVPVAAAVPAPATAAAALPVPGSAAHVLAQAPAAPQAAAEPSRFTGEPVTFDFQGADLRAVLRTFAEISGLNIVIDPTIQGTVDVSLKDVPWDQALDIILKANKLGYAADGTI
ncbi:MAG: AMIN domain-containing protein, partial [Acidobacteriota bacterium]|nr:AMIN domain-containing protein [Acidobacteriota bacterium]